MSHTLHAVETPDHWDTAYRNTACNQTFASVAVKLERDRQVIGQPGTSPEERQRNYVLQARSAIHELLRVADMPTYQGALRVLQEVRRELGTKEPDLVVLRRNLSLYLDGVPER